MRIVAAIVLTCVWSSGLTAESVVPPETRVLDTLDDTSAWSTAASEGVSASVHPARGQQGGAMVMEFDLARTAGYASAYRKLPITLPDDYELSLWIRGEAQRNHFEIKFVDASGDNVWWYRRPNFTFSGDWQELRIKRRQIEFAWGPTQDKTLRSFERVEFGISAGRDGGKGNLWFDQLSLKAVPPQAKTEPPVISASSTQGPNSAALAIDSRLETAWRSTDRGAQFLELDLQRVTEFGGIEIDWVGGLQAARYTIATSLDGKEWQTVRTVTAGNGKRDSHLLPESEARFIRIAMPDTGRQYGIAELHVRDLAFGASPNAFIQALAKNAHRGCYPRGYSGEQTYWTIVGVDSDEDESLISEDAAVEARRASFSIEPFVKTQTGLVTWADVSTEHSLADDYLPMPSVQWKHRDVDLRTTAEPFGERGNGWTRVTYQLKNKRTKAQKLTLALTVRPLQVNPPAQFLNTAGGVSPINQLAFRDNAVFVDDVRGVVPQQTPRAFVAVPFDADAPCEWLKTASLPAQVTDETGFASGALLYDVELAPNATADFTIDLPLHPQQSMTQPAFDRTKNQELWREKLNRVELSLPEDGKRLFDTLRSSLAHVLINRDGPAIQPGSRSYERSWIRDGALTSEMLLRLGHEDTVKEFVQWYAGFQFANGKTPCCVDARGADPVPENDSPGEFLFLVEETYRYTGDMKLLRTLWPKALKAFEYMEQLRLSERTEANLTDERRAFYGLMPASISHEGYSAKPMHSYWDDFWALAGYESMVRLAAVLGETKARVPMIESRDQFRADLYRSIQLAQNKHNIDYIPGAAELGDFDATSTTIALTPVGEQHMLPPLALNATFERYWRDFESRRTGSSWDAYTPYEWRVVGTFIRLGQRERAQEALEFFMDDRRPAEWNQWAEVVGREERKTRFIGDMPHGWVASDFGRSLLDMFAYERPMDETLAIMAGIPPQWVRKDGFAVKNLRTAYGKLSYTLTVKDGVRTLEIAPLTKLPPGGIAVVWPEGPEALGKQTIEAGTARWVGSELRIGKLPFKATYKQ